MRISSRHVQDATRCRAIDEVTSGGGHVVVLLTVLLCACSNKVPEDSQIAAQVNGGEISVHQVQAVLQKQPRLAAGAGASPPAQVLEVLIDQELAAQAASKRGYDSDPAVIQALQLARRETLAHAYMDQVAAKSAIPSSDEIDRYYEANPELFAQRKLYTLQEFAVEADAAQLERLEQLTKLAKGSEAVLQSLRESGMRYTTRQYVQAAEDVPLNLLQAISKLSVGQSVLVKQSGGARVFCILQAQLAPVDRRMASEAISKYLSMEQKRKLVAESMNALRKEAQIRYVGSFSKAQAATVPVAAGVPTTRE